MVKCMNPFPDPFEGHTQDPIPALKLISAVQCSEKSKTLLGPSSVCKELNSHFQVSSELAHCEINHLIICGMLVPHSVCKELNYKGDFIC